MKRYLRHRSNRWTHDGWALRTKDGGSPMAHTVCTTREEVRAVKREMEQNPDLFQKLEPVKIKIQLEVVK